MVDSKTFAEKTREAEISLDLVFLSYETFSKEDKRRGLK